MSYCVRKTIVDQLKGKAKSYVISDDMKRITIPAAKFNVDQAFRVAQSLYNKAIKLYGKFGDNVSLDQTDKYNPAVVIHPTKRLVDSFEVKAGNMTLEELNAQPTEDLTDYYMGDEALREQEERDLNQEIFLHLSSELNDKLGFDNPGYNAAPNVQDIVNQMPMITKADIDQKKLDC